MVKEAMGWKGKTMKGLEEILEVPGAGEKCLKILVVGEPINIFIFKIFFHLFTIFQNGCRCSDCKNAFY